MQKAPAVGSTSGASLYLRDFTSCRAKILTAWLLAVCLCLCVPSPCVRLPHVASRGRRTLPAVLASGWRESPPAPECGTTHSALPDAPFPCWGGTRRGHP